MRRVAAVTNKIDGMSDEFEKSVSHLLPYCTVEVKTGTNQNNVQISDFGRDLKMGTGPKSGVELRYYKPPEFVKLSDSEKEELLECLSARKNDIKKEKSKEVQVKVGKKAWNKKIKGQFSTLVKTKTAALKKQQEAEAADLNEIFTVITIFAKDQGSQKPPEANDMIPETGAV